MYVRTVGKGKVTNTTDVKSAELIYIYIYIFQQTLYRKMFQINVTELISRKSAECFGDE